MSAAATREAPATLFEALAMLQAELPKVGKGATAQYGKYADLADVSAVVLPRLGKYGLAFIAKPTMADGQFVLAYSLVHVSGEREDGLYPLPANGNSQQLGSAITYARRYSLCAVTGVAPDEDDDGAAAKDAPWQGRAERDAWQESTPARPRQPQGDDRNGAQRDRAPGPARSRPAAQDHDNAPEPSWIDTATQKAASFETEAEGAALWQEAVGKARAREITGKDKEGIRVLIGSRVEDLRTKAMNEALRLLSENDDWRLKVQEIDGEVSAREQLLELSRLIAEEGFNMTRANRISQAIIARWPKAREERPAAA